MVANKRNKIEKRHTKRLTVTFSNGTSEHTGKTSNLSSSGLFIRTRKALSPGTRMKMTIELDHDRIIFLEGEVAWSLKTGLSDFRNGMGIRLYNIPEEYKALLKETA
jgi:uncharacterized protein (TIGR02266 family)